MVSTYLMDEKIDSQETVRKLIQSKKYFSVGFDWYFDKYLGFFWQRKIFSILFLLVFIALFCLIKMNYGILIDSRIPAPIVSYTNHYNDISFARRLKYRNSKDPNTLIANYLIEKYVSIRESYRYNELDFQKVFLLNNSTSFLYLEYEKNLEILNPSSPLLLYGKNEIIIPKIKKVQIFNDDSGLPNKAEVKFELERLSQASGSKSLGSYSANLEFYMSNVYAVKKQNSDNFAFSVLRYNVIKNKN